MIWNEFIYFATVSLIFWLAGLLFLYFSKKKVLPDLFIITGLLVFATFIFVLWTVVGHPPLRTMGETRLWYSFFLVLVGYLTYLKCRFRWLVGYSIIVAGVFILINILRPEMHSTDLMPALQSPWFIPHVTVYILAYALMGAATIASIIGIFKNDIEDRLIYMIDNMIYVGFAFLLSGMLMGAIWAKNAWGDYWTWDLKEIWAFITAATFLIYIHLRRTGYNPKRILWIIPVAFIMLIITWLGVSYLPSASQSIHSY